MSERFTDICGNCKCFTSFGYWSDNGRCRKYNKHTQLRTPCLNEDKINDILNNVFEKKPELDGINYDITTSDKVDIDKSEIITRGYARGEKPKHDNTKDVLSTIGVISGAGLIASSIIEKQKQEEKGRLR